MKRRLIRILSLFLLIFVLVGCSNQSSTSNIKEKVVDPIDDNYRVFYEIFVGSFSDSNEDGVGDINGVINRIDYLNDGDINSGKSLGVQGIWLSPVFSSPSYHKYDVKDYYTIDEKFGNEADLERLITLCHRRNVKVILDLPINHTSSSNIWFQNFVNAHKNKDTSNEYYDFYSYATLSNKLGGHAYALIPGCTDEYYECNFSQDMPELNFNNQTVKEKVVEIAKHYLDLGIDGFRFDAIKYIYYSDTKTSVSFWKWYMEELKEIKEDIYCVGECWSADSETLEYVEALNCFNFQMAQGEGVIASAAKGGFMSNYTSYVDKYLNQVIAKNSKGMVIPFISNHDMDRSAGYLTLATKRMNMGANLLILCSGSPIIYYGEEIGLKGVRGASNTDANRRLAMLWGDGDTVEDPEGTTYAISKQTNGTVAKQLEDETSLLNYYSKLISFRNKYPIIARGDYQALLFDSNRFGGFLISYEDSKIGLFHNTSDSEMTIDFTTCKTAYDYEFSQLVDYIGQGEALFENKKLTIGPQTSVVLQ